MSRRPRTLKAPRELARLIAGAVRVPELPGAACAGLAPLFDADPLPGETWAERDERVAAAEHLCARCPALDRCAQLVTRRTVGVVQAGRRRGAPPTSRPLTPGDAA